MKLSPEFPMNVRPVHKGVYRHNCDAGPGAVQPYYSRWDGEKWYSNRDTVESAFEQTRESRAALPDCNFGQALFWQGLAEVAA